MKGFRFISGEESRDLTHFLRESEKLLNSLGYEELFLPLLLEKDDLSYGLEETELVEKQLFSFKDKGEREICLLPEQTSSILNFFQNKMRIDQSFNQRRLFCFSPCFRYERPQEGRYRQFLQFGVENFLSNQEHAILEIVFLLDRLFSKFFQEGTTLSLSLNFLNSNLKQQLNNLISNSKVEGLCDFCRRKLQRMPIRILDCKNCCDLMENYLLGQKEYIEIVSYQKLKVEEFILALSSSISLSSLRMVFNSKIVRGLDYYNGIVFEVEDSSSKNSLAAGGQYQKKFLEDPITISGSGFAIGLDRLLSSNLKKVVEQKKILLIYKENLNYNLILNLIEEILLSLNLYNTYIDVLSEKDFVGRQKSIVKEHYNLAISLFSPINPSKVKDEIRSFVERNITSLSKLS